MSPNAGLQVTLTATKASATLETPAAKDRVLASMRVHTPATATEEDGQQVSMTKLRGLLSDVTDDVQPFDFVFDTNINGGEDTMFTYSVPALVPPR